MSQTGFPFVVMKFGGTSVATPSRWRTIAAQVQENIARARHPVVVCSALAGVTDLLSAVIAALAAEGPVEALLGEIWSKHERLASELGFGVEVVGGEFSRLAALVNAHPRGTPLPAYKQASVLAAGELMSTRLGAAWLTLSGVRARWVDARRLLRATASSKTRDEAYLSACCRHEPDGDAGALLRRPGVEASVTQGFIARNKNGRTVVLGRGGSDTSAAYLASLLGAERLEIWTDVPGLFTADPRCSSDARLLPEVTYDEAAVLGSLGAAVLHPRCLPPVQARGIPLMIRWTDRPEVRGTVIRDGSRPEAGGIKAVTARSRLCMVSMRRTRSWQPVGFMAAVAARFRAHGLSMDLISSSPSEIRTTVDLAANPSAEDRLPALMLDLSRLCEPTLKRGLTCVSVAGSRVSAEFPRVAAVLRLLDEPRVHLVSHAADDTNISYVIDEGASAELVRAVHLAIFGERGESEQLGPTWRALEGRAVDDVPVPIPPARRPSGVHAVSP